MILNIVDLLLTLYPVKTITQISNQQNIMKQISRNNYIHLILISFLGMLIPSSCSKSNEIIDQDKNITDIEEPCQPNIVLLTDHIDITGKDLTTSFEFKIEPSETVIDFFYQGENKNIELDQISIIRAGEPDSYITQPSNYHITDVSPSKTAEGELLKGQYKVTITADAVDSDGEEIVKLVITTQDSHGNPIRLSSSRISVTYDTHPQIYRINVCGIEATKTDAFTFYIKLPYGTYAKSLATEISTNSEISIADGSLPTELDLSNPVKLTATFNGSTRDYSLIAYYSNLPVVYVNTPNPVTNKIDWVKNCTIQITNAGEYNATYTSSIRGRGNSTWIFPKKPYAIKMEEKSEVLGMPKHKRWCLLANWMDRTNIRNAVAFKIGSLFSGLEWTPSGRYVDLVFNGEFLGNYFLCEQIKIDKNRLNINELKQSDIDVPQLTGGYLLEFDKNYDEEYKFKTEILNLPVNLKSPDENVPAEQFAYIKNYINDIESKLNDHADYSKIASLMDIDSYVDWWLMHELVYIWEPNHPKSSYMYKKRDGKLYAGPAWDYDWDTFTNDYGWRIKESLWYRYLFTYDEFITKVKERWDYHKPNLSIIPDYIDSLVRQISESSVYDCSLWPLEGRDINHDELLPYVESVKLLKKNYENRYKWIDENISKL